MHFTELGSASMSCNLWHPTLMRKFALLPKEHDYFILGGNQDLVFALVNKSFMKVRLDRTSAKRLGVHCFAIWGCRALGRQHIAV